MKKVIVRTPETDRYGLSVPTLLTDLTDYGTSFATGAASSSSGATCYTAAGGLSPLPMGVTSELANVVGIPYGLRPTVPGLFLITLNIRWGAVLPPVGGGCAMPGTDRQSLVYVNGAPTGTASHDTAGYDSCTFTLRLAAGDTVEVYVDAGAAGGGFILATLHLVKVAP